MMYIPDVVKAAVVKSPLDNNYFYGAEQMWDRLTKIRNDEIEYLNIDMSMLANCVELLYKGFLTAAGIDVAVSVGITHNLCTLVTEIEKKICPLQYIENQADLKKRKIFLDELSKKYLSTKYYNDQVTKEEFQACYDWAAKQRQLIMDYLIPPPMPQITNEDLEIKEEL